MLIRRLTDKSFPNPSQTILILPLKHVKLNLKLSLTWEKRVVYFKFILMAIVSDFLFLLSLPHALNIMGQVELKARRPT
jgi:hypothetical protein